MLHPNQQIILCGIIIGEIEKIDPNAPANIEDRHKKITEEYWTEQRELKKILRSKAFWDGVSTVLSFNFFKAASPKDHSKQSFSRAEKLVNTSQKRAIIDYLNDNPDVAKQLNLQEDAKDLFRQHAAKTMTLATQNALRL